MKSTRHGQHVGALRLASIITLCAAAAAPGLALAAKPGGGGTTWTVRLQGAGDSIMRGYNATCTGNTSFLDLLCYSGGDQPENSFFDGSSTAVLSLADRFIKAGASTSYSKTASQSGSEMVGGTNNFETQAKSVVSRVTLPTQVKVELGGNDICRRTTTAELYNDVDWEAGVRKGLNVLTGLYGSTTRLPTGSTVILVGVPRVQDLHDVGVAKSSSRVNCPNFWDTYDVCEIATVDRVIGNETLAQRLTKISERQAAYNAKMKTLAAEYNSQATATGVEVVVESDGVTTVGTKTVPEVGAYRFSTTEINGGDCFHPSISGQNKLSEIIWGNDPYTRR